jgi:DNA/RNA-binding domain of Phe-tRNA-synthetase-like protein
MYFRHSSAIWHEYPELVPGVVAAEGIARDVATSAGIADHTALAESRLATQSEGELPEIQAWRRVYSKMGLKPTQYRCASESLLRRLRKEGSLPRIHPLIDLCNAVSAAFAIPVAVFDTSRVSEHLEVRHATGGEIYETFSGDTEHPDRGEVIFADGAARAHARRWTNRQSGHSAVRDDTAAVLIVAEGVHDSAATDVPRLVTVLSGELEATWSASPRTAVLSSSAPRFELSS